jgi:phosphoribosylglycinamide formyltransferase-1
MAPRDDARLPIAVLVSGSGSNLQAIIDAARDPAYGARIVAVIADRPGILALDRATAAGIPTEVVAWTSFGDRATFTGAVCDAADQHGAAALVLAGWMRILSPNAIARFPSRILNTHPALLPAFPGAHAVAEAIAHGVKLTGVTIHFVDEEVDHGPIIDQVAVAVEPGDTEASLQSRIQAEEHRVYPAVVDAFARGRLEVRGRSVIWKELV